MSTATAADLLRTDHLVGDIGRRTAHGMAFTLASQLSRFGLQLGSTAVLARALTPRDFGLVGMVTAVTGFAALFKDLGLSAATVQRQELTHEQVSNLFWINVGMSGLLMVVFMAAAPAIAWAYGEPALVAITIAIAATFLLGGLTAQHHALLRRQMQFRQIATVDVVAKIASVLVAITAALLGAGYWALVLMAAAHAAVSMVGVWAACGWRPGLPRRGAGVRPLLAFGGGLTVFSTLSYLARNADNMLIGWYWGAGPLGLYTKSYGLLMMPLQQMKAPIGHVALPALCRLQDDPERFRRFYLNVLSLIATLTVPVGAVIALGSGEIIEFFLGRQWVEAGPIFLALSLSLPVQAILTCTGWLFMASGRSRPMLMWGAASSGSMIAAFLLGLRWGPLGVAIGFTASMYILAWPLSAYAVRGTSITTSDLWRCLSRPVTAVAIGGVCALAVRWQVEASHVSRWAAFMSASAVLAVVYVALMGFVLGSFREHANLLRHFRVRRDAAL